MGLWPTNTHRHGSKRAEGLGTSVFMRANARNLLVHPRERQGASHELTAEAQ